MAMNKKALRHLIASMEQCGYKPHLTSESPLYLGIEMNDEVIGHIGEKGVRVYDDYAGEKARLQNLLAYSETFLERPENGHGHRELSNLSGHTLAAGLNLHDGTPTYYVYPNDATGNQVATAQGYKDFAAAKKVFAADAGLTDSPHGTDYRELLKNTFADLLERNGYELKASAAGENVFDIARKDKLVGSLDENLHLKPYGNSKVSTNLDSLFQQARWETDSEMYGNSVFTKRLSDFLLRLGYNIRHTLQGLSLRFTVHKDDRDLGIVTPQSETIHYSNASFKETQEIDQAVNRVKAEMRQEFSMMIQSMRQRDESVLRQPTQSLSEEMRWQEPLPKRVDAPPPPSDEHAPPPDEKDRGTGAVSCDITRTEAALVVAMLGTPAGQKMAEKFNVRHVGMRLEEKLRTAHPYIPAPGRTSRDMAEHTEPNTQQEDEAQEA